MKCNACGQSAHSDFCTRPECLTYGSGASAGGPSISVAAYDAAPCLDAEEHRRAQRHTRPECPTTEIYPTREAYARELWASLSDDDKADTLWQNDVTEADDEFFAFWTDNIDARNNGTVTFTRVEGGYTVDDEAVL